MKRLVAALLLVIVLLVPVGSLALPVATDVASLTAIAEWAGCENVIVSEAAMANAYFAVGPFGDPRIIIGTYFPEQHRFTVFLHELGHCLQYMDNSLMAMHSVERELDADGRAAQLACALHMDGPRMLRELFEYARAEFGYEGDEDHGTLAQRIEQGNRAKHWCPNVQAPYRGA